MRVDDSLRELRIRILLADDDLHFLQALETFLETTGRCSVVGQALSGLEAVALASELRPDVALVDFDMPGMTGVAVAQQIKQVAPHARVAIVTGYLWPEYADTASQPWADAFITKDRLYDELPLILERFARANQQ